MGASVCKEVENETSKELKKLIDQAFNDLKRELMECIRAEISKSQNTPSVSNLEPVNLPPPDKLERNDN